MRRPDFTRFLRTLHLQGEPDYVPLFDSIDIQVKSAFLGRKITNIKDEVEFAEKAGYDYVLIEIGFRPTWRSRIIAGQETASVKPILQFEKAQYSAYTDEENARAWANEHSGNIMSLEDFENFSFPKISDFDFSSVEKIQPLLPEGMKIIASVDGVFTPVWLLMGGENFYLSLIKNPELVAKMFQQVGGVQHEVIRRFLSYANIGALRINDDIAYNTGPLVSPKHLHQYFFPWLKKTGDICQGKNVPLIYHSDGNLMLIMDDIINSGVSALHPIQPNAMDIIEVKKRYGGRLCLIGNIDMDIMTRKEPRDVEELVKKNLRNVAPGGGYIVGASNSVPEFIPLKNYNAMRETSLKYGKYPISV
ncbi:uroporphyrinogen decarboxylase family protein [Chloroflexota bacterium]